MLKTMIAISILLLLATSILKKLFRNYKNFDKILFKRKIIDRTIRIISHLPYFGPKLNHKINAEMQSFLSEMKNDVTTMRTMWTPITAMPEQGLPEKTIRERLQSIQSHYKPGRCSSTIYSDYDENLYNLLQFVWKQSALTNPIYPQWPLINLMEAEVISMCQDLLHGEKGSPGMISHGGSMTTLEACKAYVLHARKNGNHKCEIIAPKSIHVCFDKAASILNAHLIKTPIDVKTGGAHVIEMEKAITKNTCLLVASAPSFPFGVIDPIVEIAALAKKYNLPFHIDGCLGGFVTMFAESAGFQIPHCDFRVPGVTSISIGTHKYGQTPNGSSVLLFSKACDATPTHVYLDWMGGIYVSPGIDGTRSGADIATAWSVMCYKGKNQYITETRKLLTLKQELVKEINKIDGIYIPYSPLLSIIGMRTHVGINPLLVVSHLKDRGGWSMNILQAENHKPIGFHLCLTPIHANQPDFVQAFTQDLAAAIQYARDNQNEEPKGLAKIHMKLEAGIPLFIQEKLGQHYIRIMNTVLD